MSLQRYEKNPFINDMVVPVKGKKVQLSTLGSQNNVLVNQSTGEIQGTHVTTYKKVDGAQFVKLFTANVAMTFDLTSAGIKVFTVLLWVVQNNTINKDQVDLDSLTLKDFLESHNAESKPLRLSLATFKRGISELEKSQIVAKTLRKGRYFINPNFVFNGDRIAFTTLIERKESTDNNQGELDLSS